MLLAYALQELGSGGADAARAREARRDARRQACAKPPAAAGDRGGTYVARGRRVRTRTLLEPLPFGAGDEHEQEGWRYRIVRDGPELVLQRIDDGAWVDLYGFPPEPVPRVDVETINWWACTHPGLDVRVGADRRLARGRRAPPFAERLARARADGAHPPPRRPGRRSSATRSRPCCASRFALPGFTARRRRQARQRELIRTPSGTVITGTVELFIRSSVTTPSARCRREWCSEPRTIALAP